MSSLVAHDASAMADAATTTIVFIGSLPGKVAGRLRAVLGRRNAISMLRLIRPSAGDRRLERNLDADVEDVVALFRLDLVQCVPAGYVQRDLLVGERDAGTDATDALVREVAGPHRPLVVKDEKIGEALDELVRLDAGVIAVFAGDEGARIATHRGAATDREELRGRQIGLRAVLVAAAQR